jgi:PAS domain-containing protein
MKGWQAKCLRRFFVSGIIIFLLKMMMQVRLDNEILRAEIEKQCETAEGLSKALNFHSLLMEAIPDLLYVLNPAGTIIKWNRKAEATTGYSHDELEGKHSLIFIAEEDRDAAQAGLE